MKHLNTISSIILALFLSLNLTFAATATISNSKLADGCATIVLKTGDIISANVIQISPTDVKYKRCGKPNDPEIILPLSKVLKIKDAEGEDIWKDDKGSTTRTDEAASTGQKMNGLALTSMILGILSVLLTLLGLGWITGALAIIFGSIGLYKIIRNPEIWRGKGMAISGLITGIAALVILALFVLFLL